MESLLLPTALTLQSPRGENGPSNSRGGGGFSQKGDPGAGKTLLGRGRGGGPRILRVREQSCSRPADSALSGLLTGDFQGSRRRTRVAAGWELLLLPPQRGQRVHSGRRVRAPSPLLLPLLRM